MDFLLVNNINYILSRTVFKLLQIMGQLLAFNRGVQLFNTLVLGELWVNS